MTMMMMTTKTAAAVRVPYRTFGKPGRRAWCGLASLRVLRCRTACRYHGGLNALVLPLGTEKACRYHGGLHALVLPIGRERPAATVP